MDLPTRILAKHGKNDTTPTGGTEDRRRRASASLYLSRGDFKMNKIDQIHALRARMWRDIKFILQETEEKIIQLQDETIDTTA
tara:strand:- start:833 stop:1081 length:249 start_codon:yes stop_codon:yes gene_type:complete